MDSGYLEIGHTADISIKVWARDFKTLLEQAARGMYAVMGTLTDSNTRIKITFELRASGKEDLLVSFLNELLYYLEQEKVVVEEYQLGLEGNHLKAELTGSLLKGSRIEIKAVTFHNMVIRHLPGRLETAIVFDI